MRSHLTADRYEQVARLLLLFFVCLLISAIYFIGLFGSDDLAYVNGAYGLSEPHPPTYALIGAARYTVSIPLRIALELTGHEAQKAVWLFVGVYLSIPFLAYFLIARIYDRMTALTAAVFLAANPLIFYYAGAILPDNILSIYYAGSVFLFAEWFRRLKSDRPASEWFLFFAALFSGLCYVTKEASILFFLPVAAYGLFALLHLPNSLRLKCILFAGGGFVLVLVGDMMLSTVLFKDPFVRLTTVTNMDVFGAAAGFMGRQGVMPWDRAGYISRQFIDMWPLWPLYILALLMLCFRASSIKSFLVSVDGIICVCAVWTFAYLTFGSISLKSYIGIPLQVRYYAPVAVLLCVVAARALTPTLSSSRPAVRQWCGIALLAGLLFQVGYPLARAGDAYHAHEVRAFLATAMNARNLYPETPIYADKYFSFRVLSYRNMIDVKSFSPDKMPGGEFIYLHKPGKVMGPIIREKRACRSTSASAVSDITPKVAVRLRESRLDSLDAELGFQQWVKWEPKLRVSALLLSPGRCSK